MRGARLACLIAMLAAPSLARARLGAVGAAVPLLGASPQALTAVTSRARSRRREVRGTRDMVGSWM